MAAPGPASRRPDTAVAVLDIEAGIARLMGNRAVYLRVLARFLKDYRAAALPLRGALAAGDVASAQRLVHTLKGAAGMIEAGTLHGAALALEQALRNGKGDTAALLTRVEHALDAVVRMLDDMELGEESTPQESGRDALQRLRKMLESGDGAAVELAKAAHHALGEALGAPRAAELGAAVARFDYEHALQLLGPSGPGSAR